MTKKEKDIAHDKMPAAPKIRPAAIPTVKIPALDIGARAAAPNPRASGISLFSREIAIQEEEVIIEHNPESPIDGLDGIIQSDVRMRN